MSAVTRSECVGDKPGYDAFGQFLSSACGIILGDNKQYLVNSRLSSLMDEHGICSLTELVERLKGSPGSTLYVAVVDAMTTNETSWFRDAYPYEFLSQQLLPQAEAANRALRIWSAASSSGQEPYSISIVVDEYLNTISRSLRPVKIIATDISQTVLNEAKKGLFHQIALDRGLSTARLSRYFESDGELWAIKQEIKSRIDFREFNLLGSYATLGKFDVVFCRNVLIYFSAEIKRDILSRIAGVLSPGGFLILGGAESMADYSDSFDVVRLKNGLVYQLKE